jgi:hypothetical protein
MCSARTESRLSELREVRREDSCIRYRSAHGAAARIYR